MRYSNKFDWFLLIASILFGCVNGILGPMVLIVNLKLIGSLLTAQDEYENATIDIDKFTSGMVEACLLYFAIAAAMFVAGFVGVSFC
jgi:hypothetical protein